MNKVEIFICETNKRIISTEFMTVEQSHAYFDEIKDMFVKGRTRIVITHERIDEPVCRIREKMTKSELVELLKKEFVNNSGNLDLDNLDFGNFKGDIFISEIKTEGDIYQCRHRNGGRVFSRDHENKGGVFTQNKRGEKQ